MISTDVSNNHQCFTSSSRLETLDSVIAPIGAFGNHLRWLLLLDSGYNFTTVPSEKYYNIFHGPDWPSYKDYCCNVSLLPHVAHEMHELEQDNISGFLQRYEFNTLENKITFLNNAVYSQNRTWHNWLIKEWYYRLPLNKLIKFEHELPKRSKIFNNVILTIDSSLALTYYLKFNSNLNRATHQGFCENINRYNQEVSKLDESNSLVISSDILFQPVLDKDLYLKLINWLEFENHYDTAKQIHQRWYELHRKSEQEFVNFFTELYM
jgi:hypothetical protein